MTRRHPLAECESCPLNTPDTVFVPSEIPEHPTIACVGEAPGFQEAQAGRPFVGPSGKLLKKVLRHSRYTPSQVMFTNVCLCRPPNNATPPKAAINACRSRLYAEITESQVSSVVALGGTAAAVLIDDPRTITQVRIGPAKSPTRALASSAVASVVPTWHPAYCLRNADAFPAFVSDFGKLRESRRAIWTPPTYYVVDEPEKAIAWLDKTIVPECVVDIEVGIEKDEAFGHPNEYDMLCVGLGIAKGQVVVIGENAFSQTTLHEALARFLRRTKIIAHNGKFDLAGLYPHLGGLELWFDTMLAHYALDERPGTHGLKLLAVEMLGAPQYDLELRTYIPRRGNYANIPRPILYKYNAFDVSCTWDLYELFSENLARDDLRRVHDLLVRASNQLMYLELNGISIDRTYSDALQDNYHERLSESERKLAAIVGDDNFNPRSPKQIKEFLESQGIIIESTDVAHLEAIAARPVLTKSTRELVQELLLYRKEHKLYSTYVEGIRRRLYRGRVYTTYLLHGTTSGRLASRNPNLQNIVRNPSIRKQFSVSKPENILIQADYKQAEGRVIATLAQDEYLRVVFSDPEVDMFNELSDSLYGKGNWSKEERVRTKAFFYGLSYGRQAYSIAMEYGIAPQEAEVRLRAFMDLIPATVRWQRETKQLVLSGRDLITPFGRRRRFHLITPDNQKEVLNEALSYLPQSTASDICLSALIRLRPLLRGLGWLRLTIHDALVVECPQQYQDEVSGLLASVMTEEGKRFSDYVPFSVDVSFGRSWGDL
jgi:uracil-DNA glycosylase family 4